MNRRSFLKYSAALGAGSLVTRNATGSPLWEAGAGIPMGTMVLPENPGFKTKHLITVIYGAGARKKEVFDPAMAPNLAKLATEGTVFTEDYGETANLHGFMYTELFIGRDAPSQTPRFPTWANYVRKKTGAPASDFWTLQGLSYYRGWTYDSKHFCTHPEYGLRYGSTSLTMNKIFYEENKATPREIVDLNVEKALGHTEKERKQLEEFLADVLARKSYLPPSTKRPLIERDVQVGDAQIITLTPQILKAFKPKLIDVQVLALDDAHADFGYWNYNTDFVEYVKHIETTDELLGKMWKEIQADPYLRETTSLLIRPECGRDDEVNIYGQLGHSEGNYYAHHAWMIAVGPDFRKGAVVNDLVQRRDLCPTITYFMSGQNAEHSTGHVRTQLFKDQKRFPAYTLPTTAAMPDPKPGPTAEERRVAEKVKEFARSTVGYGD